MKVMVKATIMVLLSPIILFGFVAGCAWGMFKVGDSLAGKLGNWIESEDYS